MLHSLKQRCPSSQSFLLVGRNVDLRNTQDCFQCCSTHGCNKHFCELATDHLGGTSNVDCSDKLRDCFGLNTLENVCANISHAKTICKKYCDYLYINRYERLGTINITPYNYFGGQNRKWTVVGALGQSGRCVALVVDLGLNQGIDHVQILTQVTAEIRVQEMLLNRRRASYEPAQANHGGWSGWQAWGSCSSRCGVGLMKRYRQCNNPPPSLYGHYCNGDPYEYELCNGTICGEYTTAPSTAGSSSARCVDVLDNCAAIEHVVDICADMEKAKTICRNFCGLCSIGNIRNE
ncbi:hypothetical protein CHS0354_003793 [Potamilus streckersoni]|uniref:Uncharacterized protein n=1 Tax=Potamilus streckersoni TaxID=2493646 RepID=A0AAE0T2J3_9BIVA|nr:hypothetical protein CHS0354_003793 [Potamilus streckersoni]